MILAVFRQSLTATDPPAKLTLALAGLWWDGKDDWTLPTSLHSRTKAPRVVGFMLTCI
jgi:hypothetical protein